MTFQYPEGVTDQDGYDLILYLEGGPQESRDAARRMDHRSVKEGQMSPEDYLQTWGEVWPR